MLDTGTSAPTFELPDQHGDRVALDDFEGQWVVLYFYPRAMTGGCTREAAGFRDHYEEFEERDVAVLGVSDDPVEDLREFADAEDLPFSLLSDADGEVSRAYDSWDEGGDEYRASSLRNTYVIDPEGRIEGVYEGVDPEGHAAAVLADLDKRSVGAGDRQ